MVAEHERHMQLYATVYYFRATFYSSWMRSWLMFDLAQTFAKIERAKEHIRDSDRERAAFLGGDPYTLTPEFNRETSSTLYFLDECREIPFNIPLIAGDAIHNLRTALDYLAWFG